MKYVRPFVTVHAAATQAIQSHDATKGGWVIDIYVTTEPNPFNSTPAYEADE